jgi:hypothetical protein
VFSMCPPRDYISSTEQNQIRTIRKIGIICSVKPLLTDDLRVVQKKEFSVTCYMREMYTDERPSIFIRDNPIFSSERMLHKDYYHKSSVERNLWSWFSRSLTPRRTDWP